MIDNNHKNSKTAITNTPFHGSEKLLRKMNLTLAHGLKPLIKSFFAESNKWLDAKIKDQASEKLDELYTESLKSISIHQLNVLSAFLKTLKHVFDLFEKQNFDYFEDKLLSNIEANSISSTFNQSDVDENLMQNTLIQKYEQLYKEQIGYFVQRFSVLSAIKQSSNTIPLGPHVLVMIFAKSIRLLHLDIKIKTGLYHKFEQSVISQLQPIYQEINLYLNNNGIVTGLENHISGVEDSHKSSAKEVTTLITKSNKQLPKQKIIECLFEIQKTNFTTLKNKNHAKLSPDEIQKEIFSALEKIAEKHSYSDLEQQDKATLKMVTLMFKLIAENRNIPVLIQTILAPLQLSYCVAAIFDPSLLEQKNHVAKKLLELLSSSSVGWNIKSDTNRTFINNLKAIIASIINCKNLDAQFFETTYNTYKTFLLKNKSKFKVEQTIINNKSKGKEKIVEAMKTVDALLSFKTENISMPLIIKNILHGPWKNLLMLLLVRHSNTSEKYLKRVQFIDELIKVLDSRQYEAVVQKKIDVLSEKYKEGLILVAYNGDELQKRVNEFQECLLKLHKIDSHSKKVKLLTGKAPENITESLQMTQADSTKVDLAALNDPQRNFSKTKATQIFNGLKVGDPIEFSRENKSSVQAQLSWINPKSGRYIFVNERGLKVTDKSPEELIQGLKDRSINCKKT